ncbi:MAG: hypothetical protein JXB17_04090 [Bacteroidales bacterium]|nr:hypothetical protein [Bacteroidales bacterium]
MINYDYIIGGSGCSGLMFAYLLNQSKLKDKKILLLDVKKKIRNDRTFCFWENGENIFENIIYKKWQNIEIKNNTHTLSFKLKNYNYKMIRGIDYYNFIKKNISNNQNIDFINEKIINYYKIPDGVRIKTNQNNYVSKYYFNSIPEQAKNIKNSKFNSLTQHFLGWFIETEEKAFNPNTAIFMDYSVFQNSDLRFCYVLPYSEKGTLIEYTIFSQNILKAEEYKIELENYITNNLKIKDYKITHKEFGKILMTDYTFSGNINNNIINIGISSGMVKPSCGFAFKRIQKQLGKLIKLLEKGKKPNLKTTLWKKRFRLYDSTFLNVLTNNNVIKKNVFFNLFKNNNASQIFKLLDEKTNVFEEIRIFITVDIRIFLKAILIELYKFIKRYMVKRSMHLFLTCIRSIKTC